jgi:mannobiose 2-epimerase
VDSGRVLSVRRRSRKTRHKQDEVGREAEAMVGYYNAYHLTGNKKFYELSLGSWSFIKANLKSTSGEWLWGIDEKQEPMIRNGKIGPWKGPYHNGRACMEMLKRIH